MKPIVAYIRVSTSQQGRSGLGTEAQREALNRFAGEAGYELAADRDAPIIANRRRQVAISRSSAGDRGDLDLYTCASPSRSP
jgi:DNA invertase Pin-like site-specific DNA recombinase